MTEEHSTYDHDDRDDDSDGVERIGDVLHRFVDLRRWPLPVDVTRANGDGPVGNGHAGRGDG